MIGYILEILVILIMMDILFLVGRKDDMINIGGEKVFPKEIEDIIGSMKEIDEVAVKGISDKLLGQIVQVYVVTEARNVNKR